MSNLNLASTSALGYGTSSSSSSSSSDPGPSRQRVTGSWIPLPYIHSGFCIYPYQPDSSPPPTPATTVDDHKASSNRNRFSWSGNRDHLDDLAEGKSNVYEVPLDIGDEFFAFEEYRCSLEEDGRGDVWYRGYVVQAVSLPSLAPSSSASHSATFPRPEPSVLIGIFPAAAVHVRPGTSSDNGELAKVYERAVRAAEEKARNANPSWIGEMDTVKEEEEGEGYDVASPQKHSDLESDVVDVANQNGGTRDVLERRSSVGKRDGLRSNRPKSLVFESRATHVEEDKEQPPLPKLTAGDSTVAGQQWPLVDEIACAIREWYGRLPTYLANREYRLFNAVMQHIDALFLGRRQLLSQTLSGDELVRVRRECISRLVKCNVAQGLEVIVRSLEDGSVMVVDKGRAFAGARWAGGIACYVYQVQLAYIDLIPLDNLLGNPPSLIDPRPSLPPVQHFSFDTVRTKGLHSPPNSGSYYHCYLDVRAFVANPCGPGETAELYFSLYNKVESRFVTEEFCLILNHLGSPARDGEHRIGRLRTLFTDLKIDDLTHDIFLVCRIVRNGALKTRYDTGSTAIRPTAGKRTSLYGISEGSPRNGNPSMLDALTDDSFSVTSGYGGQRAPTIETSYTTNGQSSVVEGKPTFRRPMGCAAVELPPMSRLLAEGTDKIGGGVELNVPIYLPKEEATFATLHENIIHRKVKEYVTSPRAEGIALSLKVFQGPAPQVIREHPSLLSDIPLSARLGFPDVVYPGIVRNDLYIKLWSAVFTPAPTSSGGSIRVRKSVLPTYQGDVQVTVEVRRGDGSIVQDALVAGGSGEPAMGQYHSLVFHRNDRPTFGELVKISLPASAQVEGYHLFLTFRSRGKERHLNYDSSELEKPFAFAYLPLADGGVCVKDGDHELALYKPERDFQFSPNIYFEAPPLIGPENIFSPTLAKGLTPLRDRVTLRTYLCSTIQTQDETLRALFIWHNSGSDINLLCSTLQLFSFVSEDEIAKFVPSVFDALFTILGLDNGNRQEEVESLVFKSLIKVLAMSSDRRFPNFKNVLNLYIDTQFKYPSSSFNLLRCMKKVMSTPKSTEYRSFLKVWHLFFKFIIRSREHDRAKGIGLASTSAHIEADFRNQTRSILEEINRLMDSSDKVLIGTQTLAVQHYADILPDLAQVFQPLEIAEMVIAFADTLTFATGSIAIYKLLLLLEVVKNVFESSESRALLVPAIVRWVKPHLGRFDELRSIGQDDSQITRDGKRIRWLECNRLAVTVIAWTVNKVQEWLDSPLIRDHATLKIQEEDNIEYCLTLLPSLYDSYFELLNSKTLLTLNRQRSSPTSTIWKPTPDVFPSTHPFALISELPPPSLLERHQNPSQDALPDSETFNCGLAETAVVILTLVLSSPKANITRWMTEMIDIEGVSSLSQTLKSSFDFCSSVVRFTAFPNQWLTLALMSFSSVFRFLSTVTPLLETEHFIPSVQNADTFDVSLWTKCFELLCELCGSDELALEDMTQQRRRAEWIIAGDLRDEGSALLMRLWNAIGWPIDMPHTQNRGDEPRYGGYQTRFTGLAERILGLCLSSHDVMCETAVEILFSMIYAEYVIEGKFDTIETEIFAKLDRLFSKSNTTASDPTMRAYFVAHLRAVFESTPSIDEGFTQRVSIFLDEIELFIDLLLSLNDIPGSIEWSDEKMSAIHKLMGFVGKIGRNDLYIKFIQQLVSIAVENKNWSSAGLAMRLNAEIYEWKIDGDLLDELVQGKIRLPPQTQFARKESLYYHAIEYFVEAEAYECALELCQELTVQHQRLTFDVPKLSELFTYQAGLWEKIGSGGRSKPEYFRLAYYGEFGQSNQDKDFVIRGEPWQRYSEFCDAIQLKYPKVTIHRSKIPPLSSSKESTDPLIWITPLTPEPDLTKPVFGDAVIENVQSHWRYNGIREFSTLRPYMRDLNEVEVVLTWTEKTVVTTQEELPGILNRSEVINVRYEQIPPVHMAISEVEKATKNLRKLSKGKNGQLPEPKLLGTAINGAVDSPVSGGVKTYRKVFLDGTYVSKHPEFTSEVDQLRQTILEYVKTIQDSLKIHKVVCRDIAFHEALKTQYYRTFAQEISLLPRRSETSFFDETPTPFSESNSSQPHFQFTSTSPPDHPLPPLPTKNESAWNSPRISDYSTGSNAGRTATAGGATYNLPRLKLNKNNNQISTLSLHTSSPRESISTTRTRQSQTPTPSASNSNPNSNSTSAHLGNRSNQNNYHSVSNSNSNSNSGSNYNYNSINRTPSEKRSSWNSSNGIGLGARAMSMVGLNHKAQSQSQTHTSSEIGTIDQYNSSPIIRSDYTNTNMGSNTNSGQGIKKEKGVSGLKRFGSLIRREK
ncbi:uncharacterized protein IL334_007306 [Kwoniella shivajii]|uniref:Cytoplasmic protein n=1 Tax=Kwoniella shivajii TaxID=564305 RepID=A0ABZ1D8T0_9TREE|nr:hypothetical protein IL334_007306 [Kwoniella shivajii]